MRATRTGLAAAALGAAFLTFAGPAAADDWGDARKAFRDAMKSKEWKERKTALIRLRDFDRAEAAEEVLSAIPKETNGAVLVACVAALSAFHSAEATAALAAAARSAKGPKRALVMMALEEQSGDASKDVLLEVLGGGDAPSAARAALALGKKRVAAAVPPLLGLLKHKDWQVRSAAARALAATASSVDRAGWAPLAESLAASAGRERGDLVEALKAVTRQDFGHDVAAWKALAAGADPATIARKPTVPPHVVGIPIYGRRVVVVLEHSNCTDDPHPFEAQERLQELCKVPGARDVPWYQIRTTGQFYGAHAKRLIADLASGTMFDLITVAAKEKALFGKWTPANPGTHATAAKAIDGLKPETGLDVHAAVLEALDLGGKEPASWQAGPDEIVLFECGNPWLADVTDPEVVGATIGLAARMRMVPVHTIGVGAHPSAMLQQIADLSGGRYLDLTK
jgi:hypothetical protein